MTPSAIPPGVVVVEVYSDRPDDLGRVRFFASWADDNQWRGGSGTSAQAFHTKLSDFTVRQNERGHRVMSLADYEAGRAWRRGMRFKHARQIARTSTAANPVPEICEVTAVRNGVVYFRNSTGFRSYAPIAKFPDYVKEWITPDV
jgi:hypothetical protein